MSDAPKIGSFPGNNFVQDQAAGDLTSVVRGGTLTTSTSSGGVKVGPDTASTGATVLATTGLTFNGQGAPVNTPPNVVALTYVEVGGSVDETTDGEPDGDSDGISATDLNLDSPAGLTPNPDTLAGLTVVDLGD